MARQGLQRGFNQGILQGVKTGLGMANHRTGFAGGITDGTANMDKLQDPVLLASARNSCPFFFWNADNVTLSGNTVTAVTNLLGTFNPLWETANATFVIGASPQYVSRDVFNNRASINFGAGSTQDVLTTNGVTTYLTTNQEMTVMMVCNPSSAGILFWKKDSLTNPPSIATVGDFDITFDGTNINVNLVGNPTTQTATYTTTGTTIKDNWIILTVRARLSEPNGPGSCIDIHVNGTRNNYLVTDTITSLPQINTTDTWQNSYINFGNHGNSTGGGNSPGGRIAAGLIIAEWINESEQIRLENYFRDYYGTKF